MTGVDGSIAIFRVPLLYFFETFMTHVCSVYGPYALSMVVRRPTKCCPRCNGAAERPPPHPERTNGVRPTGLSLQ